MISIRTLTDGGQQAVEIAHEIGAFLGAATTSLDAALYDLRLHDASADEIVNALAGRQDAGVGIRVAFNRDYQGGPPVPPPPQADWNRIDALPVPTKPIPGVPDLMHHKYVIRDRRTVLTGSTNWTDDSWTREENVFVTVDSPEVAARYTEDFEQLWTRGDVQHSGRVETAPIQVGDATVRTWFTPEHGDDLAHRIAKQLSRARRRIRIASPVITSGPILGTLAQVAADRKVDLAGVVDATQIHEVLSQWHENGNASWKTPALRFVLEQAPFTGKLSTPYAPGSVHDYMHAKVTVADDTAFVGSFNLSHSGELNAENILEIEHSGLADELAAFVDSIRLRYSPVRLLAPANSIRG